MAAMEATKEQGAKGDASNSLNQGTGRGRGVQYLHICGSILTFQLQEAKAAMVAQLDTNSKRDLFGKMRNLGDQFDENTLVPQYGMTIGEIATLLELTDKGGKSR